MKNKYTYYNNKNTKPKDMKTSKKSEGELALINQVYELNRIIRNANVATCYDTIVEFFALTSKIQDDGVYLQLPLKGWSFLGFKSPKRKKAEEKLYKFCVSLERGGRNQYGHNRTSRGEAVTKNNVFFGDINGICTNTVAAFQKSEDPHVQQEIRTQITHFVESYKGCFSLDWVRD